MGYDLSRFENEVDDELKCPVSHNSFNQLINCLVMF